MQIKKRQEIANETINNLVDYTAEKLPYVAVADIAGIIIGGFVSIFTTRS
jgi:hypothetical protein